MDTFICIVKWLDRPIMFSLKQNLVTIICKATREQSRGQKRVIMSTTNLRLITSLLLMSILTCVLIYYELTSVFLFATS